MDVTDPIKAMDAVVALAGRAVDLAVGLKGLARWKSGEVEKLHEVALALRQKATAAQEESLTLREENLRLNEKVRQLTERDLDRKKLALKQVAPGTFVYARKRPGPAAQGDPWYCQPCYDGGKKGVFQFAESKPHFDTHQCPLCGAAILLPNGREAAVLSGRGRGPYDDFIGG